MRSSRTISELSRQRQSRQSINTPPVLPNHDTAMLLHHGLSETIRHAMKELEEGRDLVFETGDVYDARAAVARNQRALQCAADRLGQIGQSIENLTADMLISEERSVEAEETACKAVAECEEHKTQLLALRAQHATYRYAILWRRKADAAKKTRCNTGPPVPTAFTPGRDSLPGSPASLSLSAPGTPRVEGLAVVTVEIYQAATLWSTPSSMMSDAFGVFQREVKTLLCKHEGWLQSSDCLGVSAVFGNISTAAGFAHDVQHDMLIAPWPQSLLTNRLCGLVSNPTSSQTVLNGLRFCISVCSIDRSTASTDPFTHRTIYRGQQAVASSKMLSLSTTCDGGETLFCASSYRMLARVAERSLCNATLGAGNVAANLWELYVKGDGVFGGVPQCLAGRREVLGKSAADAKLLAKIKVFKVMKKRSHSHTMLSPAVDTTTPRDGTEEALSEQLRVATNTTLTLTTERDFLQDELHSSVERIEKLENEISDLRATIEEMRSEKRTLNRQHAASTASSPRSGNAPRKRSRAGTLAAEEAITYLNETASSRERQRERSNSILNPAAVASIENNAPIEVESPRSRRSESSSPQPKRRRSKAKPSFVAFPSEFQISEKSENEQPPPLDTEETHTTDLLAFGKEQEETIPILQPKEEEEEEEEDIAGKGFLATIPQDEENAELSPTMPLPFPAQSSEEATSQRGSGITTEGGLPNESLPRRGSNLSQEGGGHTNPHPRRTSHRVSRALALRRLSQNRGQPRKAYSNAGIRMQRAVVGSTTVVAALCVVVSGVVEEEDGPACLVIYHEEEQKAFFTAKCVEVATQTAAWNATHQRSYFEKKMEHATSLFIEAVADAKFLAFISVSQPFLEVTLFLSKRVAELSTQVDALRDALLVNIDNAYCGGTPGGVQKGGMSVYASLVEYRKDKKAVEKGVRNTVKRIDLNRLVKVIGPAAFQSVQKDLVGREKYECGMFSERAKRQLKRELYSHAATTSRKVQLKKARTFVLPLSQQDDHLAFTADHAFSLAPLSSTVISPRPIKPKPILFPEEKREEREDSKSPEKRGKENEGKEKEDTQSFGSWLKVKRGGEVEEGEEEEEEEAVRAERIEVFIGNEVMC